MTDTVTLGGLVTGLCILAFVLVRWWATARFKWLQLAPFVLSLVYGTLLILTTGGVVGQGAGWTLWGANRAGDAALEHGVGGGTPDATRAVPGDLTDGGHGVIIILTVALLAYVWFSRRLRRLDVALGVVAGICLGLSTGWAGWVASWAGEGVNLAGAWLTGGH